MSGKTNVPAIPLCWPLLINHSRVTPNVSLDTPAPFYSDLNKITSVKTSVFLECLPKPTRAIVYQKYIVYQLFFLFIRVQWSTIDDLMMANVDAHPPWPTLVVVGNNKLFFSFLIISSITPLPCLSLMIVLNAHRTPALFFWRIESWVSSWVRVSQRETEWDRERQNETEWDRERQKRAI